MGRSNETRLFEVIIGLYDLAQLVFGAAVPAVRVGVVALHEFLETSFDLRSHRSFRKIQRLERLALERLEGPARSLAPGAMRYGIAVIQYAMGIGGAITGELGIPAGPGIADIGLGEVVRSPLI